MRARLLMALCAAVLVVPVSAEPASEADAQSTSLLPGSSEDAKRQARGYARQLDLESPGDPFTYRVVTYDRP